jgi:hydroxymethylbilane synthase
MKPLRLATRASPLALWQARAVASALRWRFPGLPVALVPVESAGDRDRHADLARAGTVGIFVKEIQDAVLRGEADAGVHSCKDLPTAHPHGLALAAVLARADARDCLVGAAAIAELPAGAIVGSSSLRRITQLQRLRPDLRFQPIRGNVDTRLRKVAMGAYAATVMACAGLARLGLLHGGAEVPLVALHPERDMVPAPAQGAIAVDCRLGDPGTRRLLAAIDHHGTRVAIAIERAVLARFAGGCSLPLGCHARRSREDPARWRVVARLVADAATAECVYEGSAAGAPGSVVEALVRAGARTGASAS